jgi:type II secretory pathway component PulF
LLSSRGGRFAVAAISSSVSTSLAVLMLFMGGLIGTVVVLMYLPIFQLAEQTQ